MWVAGSRGWREGGCHEQRSSRKKEFCPHPGYQLPLSALPECLFSGLQHPGPGGAWAPQRWEEGQKQPLVLVGNAGEVSLFWSLRVPQCPFLSTKERKSGFQLPSFWGSWGAPGRGRLFPWNHHGTGSPCPRRVAEKKPWGVCWPFPSPPSLDEFSGLETDTAVPTEEAYVIYDEGANVFKHIICILFWWENLILMTKWMTWISVSFVTQGWVAMLREGWLYRPPPSYPPIQVNLKENSVLDTQMQLPDKFPEPPFPSLSAPPSSRDFGAASFWAFLSPIHTISKMTWFNQVSASSLDSSHSHSFLPLLF